MTTKSETEHDVAIDDSRKSDNLNFQIRPTQSQK